VRITAQLIDAGEIHAQRDGKAKALEQALA
jgi:hypothetical protein